MTESSGSSHCDAIQMLIEFSYGLAFAYLIQPIIDALWIYRLIRLLSQGATSPLCSKLFAKHGVPRGNARRMLFSSPFSHSSDANKTRGSRLLEIGMTNKEMGDAESSLVWRVHKSFQTLRMIVLLLVTDRVRRINHPLDDRRTFRSSPVHQATVQRQKRNAFVTQIKSMSISLPFHLFWNRPHNKQGQDAALRFRTSDVQYNA